MPSSNVIRGAQQDECIKPATFAEVGTEAVYQSDWVITGSNVAPNSSEVSVYEFPLSEPYIETGHHESMAPDLEEDADAEQQGKPTPSCQTRQSTHNTGKDQADEVQRAISSGQDQADILLQQAQQDAERCLEEARQKATAIESEGYQAGWQKGEQAARGEMQTQFASVLASFQQAISEVMRLRQEVVQQAEEDVITLAFQLARKIVQREVLDNHGVIGATLRRALSHAMTDDTAVVRVNPADLEQVRELHIDILHDIGTIRQLSIEGDDTIGRGGCIVELAFGEIDARVEAQLEELEHRFREQRNLVSEVDAV